MSLLQPTFEALKKNKKTAFIPFIMAGDPSHELFCEILHSLPATGADIIEIGIPFTDPVADGPTIEAAGKRALNGGQTLAKTLQDIHDFKQKFPHIPIILMGYYNPIYVYGVQDFLKTAKDSGVDGLIIVDLPLEEDRELCLPAKQYDIDFIRLITPTTDPKRLDEMLKSASGFLYYISVIGITGQKSANLEGLSHKIKELQSISNLPVAIGFGIKSNADVENIKNAGADAIVIGSAIVDRIKDVQNKKDIALMIEDIKSMISGLKK